MFFGAGCHPSRRIALLRALTEAAQSRLTYISGARDDIERRDYRRPGDERRRNWYRGDGRRDGPPHAGAKLRRTQDCRLLNEDLRLGTRPARGRRHSSQVIAVDLSMPEFGVPVVKVVIPGLEGVPDDPSYSPGARVRAKSARPHD